MSGVKKVKYKLLFIFISVLIVTNLLLLFIYNASDSIVVFHDVDRTSKNTTFVTYTKFAEMMNHKGRIDNQDRIDLNNYENKIIEIDEFGNIIWEMNGVAIPHEILQLPNGHLMIADTEHDRFIEIDYPNKNIIWSWEPAMINWTIINEEWDVNHYYNNPSNGDGNVIYDWTHINDVEFKNYGSYDACLISIRNFDLIVEVNYTADFKNPNDPNNILWWYGDYGAYELLNHQHNPDYLSNGNIIIADSGNDRIIEVDYNTKDIIWEYNTDLMWPRDADELENGNLLITDSNGCRVIELNRTTNEIVWMFDQDLLIPYEADKLPNGNVLISSEYHGLILEVNKEGNVVWSYGNSYIKAIFILNSLNFIGISIITLYFKLPIFKEFQKLSVKEKSFHVITNGLFLALLAFGVILLFFNSNFISGLVRILYQIVGSGAF